jgi:hypothetical protein
MHGIVRFVATFGFYEIQNELKNFLKANLTPITQTEISQARCLCLCNRIKHMMPAGNLQPHQPYKHYYFAGAIRKSDGAVFGKNVKQFWVNIQE